MFRLKGKNCNEKLVARSYMVGRGPFAAVFFKFNLGTEEVEEEQGKLIEIWQGKKGRMKFH